MLARRKPANSRFQAATSLDIFVPLVACGFIWIDRQTDRQTDGQTYKHLWWQYRANMHGSRDAKMCTSSATRALSVGTGFASAVNCE